MGDTTAAGAGPLGPPLHATLQPPAAAAGQHPQRPAIVGWHEAVGYVDTDGNTIRWLHLGEVGWISWISFIGEANSIYDSRELSQRDAPGWHRRVDQRSPAPFEQRSSGSLPVPGTSGRTSAGADGAKVEDRDPPAAGGGQPQPPGHPQPLAFLITKC